MKKVERSRTMMAHPEINPGKVAALDALQTEYAAYVRACVDLMVDRRVPTLPRSAKQAFFPRAEALSSQIEKNARDHALGIVSGWARAAYTNTTKAAIRKLEKAGEIDETRAKALRAVGKNMLTEPEGRITAEVIDAYWTLLESSVKRPTITERIGIRMSEMTCRIEDPESDGATLADLWLRISTLAKRKSVWIPLVGSPFVRRASDVRKGVLARKKNGRWRFEALDTKAWEVAEPDPNAPRIGVDVGLNVIAATSDGRLIGADLKPKFDALYAKVRDLRSNRFRQGLKKNSPRLDALESKLSGLTKTATGEAANILVASYPGHVFVVEDLDLRGCRGQKRFCYRGLHHALETKAPTIVVNPAYTSQECPSCGYFSRANRSGTKFLCRSCGRKSHADAVGAINLLGRSEDEQIDREDEPSEVMWMLGRRFLVARTSPPRSMKDAPEPSGRRLTVRGTTDHGGTRTASNAVVSFG